MRIKPFKLERYFARYEFSAPYLLSSSDCEPLSLPELLSLSDPESRFLWDNLKMGYTESQGLPLLREEVSRLYTTIKPEDVLIAAPQECIFIAMNTLLKKGDHVITTFPGYQSLYEIALAIGCEVSRWTPRQDSPWTFDVSDLKSLLRPNTKLMVINFPHNPTGAILKETELNEIVGTAEQNNISLFSDEMYRFLEYDQDTQTTSACDLSPKALSLFGMSKSFALAGLRIGWITTRNKPLIDSMIRFKDYTSICSSAPSEVLSLMALRAKKEIFTRNLGIIETNLSILDSFFAQHPDLFAWSRPQAGPIAFPKYRGKVDTGELCRDLVEKKGVMLLPSNQYDFGEKHFRLGFARQNLPKALDRFNTYLSEQIWS
jgi:aspartate/methionine/tyrosine aminotransferase